MSEAPRDLQARIADYVTGDMSTSEATRIEAEMNANPALANQIAEYQAMLAEIDETAARLDPPAGLWSRIEAGLETAKAAGRPAQPMRAPLWESIGFWRWATAATAAAAIILAAVLGYMLPPIGPQPIYVAVLVAEGGTEAGAIVEVDRAGAAWLVPLREIEVPEGRALQVWTLQDREAGPVSVGLTPDARKTRLEIGGLPPTRPDQLFEITLEPETGSPTGRPTGPILFKGTAVRAL